MNRAGDFFFARAGVALHENAERLGGHAFEHREELAHFGRAAEKAFEARRGRALHGGGALVGIDAQERVADAHGRAHRELRFEQAVISDPRTVGASRVAHEHVSRRSSRDLEMNG